MTTGEIAAIKFPGRQANTGRQNVPVFMAGVIKKMLLLCDWIPPNKKKISDKTKKHFDVFPFLFTSKFLPAECREVITQNTPRFLTHITWSVCYFVSMSFALFLRRGGPALIIPTVQQLRDSCL